jgi:Domain of unknown function (DUF4252)
MMMMKTKTTMKLEPSKSMWGQPPRLSRQAQRDPRHHLAAGVVLLLLLLALPARAQEFKIPPDVEKLSSKAKETVEVTMDGPMLHWASKFLSAEDPDEKRAAAIVNNLKAIYVRSYEFDHEHAYTAADVESLRAAAHAPGWTRVVGVRSETDGENVDVFFKIQDDKMAGIVVIAAEPQELTFVHIEGPIELDQLTDLSGEFGVPHFKLKGLTKDNLSKMQKDSQKKDATKGDRQ